MFGSFTEPFKWRYRCGDIIWHHERWINLFAKTLPLKLRLSRLRF